MLSRLHPLRHVMGRGRRGFCSDGAGESITDKNRRTAKYLIGGLVFCFGFTYASVPLYQAFCQATGFGGTARKDISAKRFKSQQFKMATKTDKKPELGDKEEDHRRLITVEFDSYTPKNMPWTFTPLQKKIEVYPGETALVFYRAKNTSTKAVTGVATYNVLPLSVGLYFNKIQCFCFEEQRLRPGEEIDMPILFFLDQEMATDKRMTYVRDVILSYTFFKVEEDDDDAHLNTVKTETTKPENKAAAKTPESTE